MDFLNLVKKRQSQRGYSSQAVEPEKIMKCIEAARLAPSACNSQPWFFIVVDQPELKTQVAGSMSNKILPLNHFTNQAPVIVALIDKGSNFSAAFGGKVMKKTYHLLDTGIAATHFCMQATSEGLSTCMLGWFNESKVKKLLSVPKKYRIELLITVGYADTEELRPKKRKELNQIVSFNKYTEDAQPDNPFYKTIE